MCTDIFLHILVLWPVADCPARVNEVGEGLTLFGGGVPHPGHSREIEEGAGVQQVSGALQSRGRDLNHKDQHHHTPLGQQRALTQHG